MNDGIQVSRVCCRPVYSTEYSATEVIRVRFQPLHNAVDNVFGELRQSGVGSEEKSAEFFTKEDENNLWAREVNWHLWPLLTDVLLEFTQN